jgi:HAD superfamily hydrolase (TIGR01509 family)
MNPKPDFNAVIFDMDGVIVDSEPCHERAILEVIRESGYGPNHGLQISDYIGRSDQDVWKDFIARQKPRQTLEELLAMKRRRTVAIIQREQPFFDGAVDLLEKLSRRCRLGLASGSDRAVVEAVLALKNLRRFFSSVVTGSEIQHGKPAPDIFLKTAELLAVNPKDCWVVEDSKPGVAAALAAGMRVIAIANTHPASELGSATRVVSNYGEIWEMLCGPAKQRRGRVASAKPESRSPA